MCEFRPRFFTDFSTDIFGPLPYSNRFSIQLFISIHSDDLLELTRVWYEKIELPSMTFR
jgi:hypothetical protein